MAIRESIQRHPHVTAMVTFVLAFVIWEWLLPLAWHQPPDLATSISMSVVLMLVSYFNRLRAMRVKALIMGALSLGALVVYAIFVRAHGIPQDATERFSFAGVVAIPIFGLALAFWTLRKPRQQA